MALTDNQQSHKRFTMAGSVEIAGRLGDKARHHSVKPYVGKSGHVRY